jgi:cephalosporin hydroxylase
MRVEWKGDLLHLNGRVFHVNHVPDAEHPPDALVVRKTRPMVERILVICEELRPRRILELGTESGGSAILWNELLQPEKMVTVDLDSAPLELPGISTYRGVDQADTTTLREIVTEEFDGRLDLVLDDASHFYEPTRASFEALFPLLRAGGFYVLEDWRWEIQPGFERPVSWRDAEGLVRLVEELVRRVGPEVMSLTLHRGFAAAERA